MIVPDVFTAALDPAVERAAVDVLTATGYRVAVAPFVASGKFDHVKGDRNRFARAAADQERLVRSITKTGAIPVVIEPATGLLHHHDYPAIRAGYPQAARHLADVLDSAPGSDSEPEGGHKLDDGQKAERPILLLGHCTERATAPTVLEAWTRILGRSGYRVEVPAIGCCGMAGVFGHEVGNQDLSRAIFDTTWAGHLDSIGKTSETVAATGYSCRSQAARFGYQRPVHPVEILAADLA